MNGQANVSAAMTLEINYDPNLSFVALKVYDDSGASPVLLTTLPMPNVFETVYRAKYTPSVVGTYLFYKAVYTDGAYATRDDNYSPNSESIQVVDSTSMDIALILKYVYQIMMTGAMNVQIEDNNLSVEIDC